MNRILHAAGNALAKYLASTSHAHGTSPPTRHDLLRQSLQPGDVLLVEGHSRISSAIKYLTQSTWSHAAIYIGDANGAPHFIEADMVDGVRQVGLAEFTGLHCRICRPVMIAPEDLASLLAWLHDRLGETYDLRNVFDLARYLIPLPAPTRLRRRMMSFGSGDPTRAICSTLLARAFASIRYPILPEFNAGAPHPDDCPDCINEILQCRRAEMIVPRDFDVSPYFEIVKPSLVSGFSYKTLEWVEG